MRVEAAPVVPGVVASVAGGDDAQSKSLEHFAEVTGKSAAAIKNHLWQATRRGLLERSPGRAGGRVSAKAAELIESGLRT